MNDLYSLLEKSGAILKGHFLLSSGRHSYIYFEKFRILEQAEVLSEICGDIAANFKNADIDIVAGPTTGGILIAFEVARRLGKRALYIERENGKRVLRRGASISPGSRVLVVDDVLTTGGSVFEVVELLRESGASIAGVGLLVDRSEGEIDFGATKYAAVKVQARSYSETELPDWLAAIPISQPGTRNVV